MLSSMRSKAGGWVAKAFILLLAASFAVWGVSDVFSGRQSDVIAEVGTRQISGQAFQSMFNRQLRALSSQFGSQLTPDQARALGIDRQVLGQMLKDAALEAQADKLGLQISGTTIAQRIADDKQFQDAQGNFNADRFRRLLQANGLSEQAFVIAETQAVKRQAIANTIQQGADVPDTLVKSVYKFRNEQRDAQYFVVTESIDEVDAPSADELKTFYDNNQRLFAVPELREVAILQVTPQKLADGIQVSDDEIERYYDSHKDDFGTPEKRTIEQITFASDADAKAARDRIATGTSFEDIAAERGISGNDLSLGTLLTRSDIPDEAIAQAAFALPVDEVSQPVAGKLATALLRVTEISSGTTKTLDEARADIVKALQIEKARDEVLNVHDKIEDARAGGQSLDEIAQSLSLDIVKTPALNASGTSDEAAVPQDVVELPAIMRAAFDSDVGIENDALTTGQDGYTWYAVTNVVAATTKPLDAVREEAVKAWKSRQLRTRLQDRGEALKSRAEGGESIEALANEAGAQVKSQTGLKRNEASETFSAEAVGALFSAPSDGYAWALEPDGTGVRLMKSTPVLDAPFDPSSSEAKSIRDTLSQTLVDDLYTQYLADLQVELGSTVNEAGFARASGRQQ